MDKVSDTRVVIVDVEDDKLAEASDTAYAGEEQPETSPWKAAWQAVAHTFQDIFTALLVFSKYLVTAESLVVAAMSVGTTLFYCYYRYAGHALAANLSWQFFAFAVVFPLTMNMNEAFKRRESALAQFAVLKANIITIYMAHRDWDWATKQAMFGGRAALPKGHVEEVRAILRELVNAMSELMSAPMVFRGRHQATPAGQRKMRSVQDAKKGLNARVFLAFNRMSAACEEMKAAGLPGNEAARLRQYNTNMWAAWETMRILKRYRTPLSMRSFSRLYIWAHPFLMARRRR